MATQLDSNRVAFQPSGPEAIQPIGAFDRIASQFQALASNQLQTANAAFDKALSSYNEIAVYNAEKDAAGIVKRDGSGQLIPPSSYWPSGFHSAAYAKAYARAAEATYQQSAAADYTNYVNEQRAKYPTDPVALESVLKVRREAMVAGMPEDQKGYLGLRLEQISAQGVSQTAVAQTATVHRANLERAEQERLSIVDEAARNIATIMQGTQAPPSGEENLKAGGQAVINSAMLGKRWTAMEAQYRAAGVGDAQIQRFRDELGYHVFLKYQGEQIRNAVFSGDEKGRIDQKFIADKQEAIRELAKLYPGRSQQIEDTLNRSLDYAVQQSSRLAASQQLADQKKNEAEGRKYQTMGERARQSKDPVEKQILTEELDRAGLATLNDPTINDSSAMIRAGYARQAGAISLASLQESYTQRLVGLGGIINDPTQTSAAKERAYSEVLTIATDPNITQHMTPGQRTYAQGMMDRVTSAKLGADHAGMKIEMLEGRQTPEVYEQAVRANIASGMYGNYPGAQASIPEAIDMIARQKKAFDTRMDRDVNSRNALTNQLTGRRNTPDETKAINATDPLRLPGEETVPDWSNPGKAPDALPQQRVNVNDPQHRMRVVDHFRRTGELDGRAVQAMKDMRKSPNEADMEGYKALYQDLHRVVDDKFRLATGKAPLQTEIRSELTNLIGEDTTLHLELASIYGAKDAFEIDRNNATKNSLTAGLGQPTGEALKTMQGMGDDFVKRMQVAGPASGWWNKLMAGRNPFTDRNLTDAERQTTGLAQASPDVRPGIVAGVLGSGVALPADVRFSDQAMAILTPEATARLAANGQLIAAAVRQSGQTPQQFSFDATVEAHKGDLELVVDPKTGKGTIDLKSWEKASAEAIGRDKLSARQGQNQAIALVQAIQRQNGINTPFQNDSVSVLPTMDSRGQKHWYISGRDLNNQVVELLDIPANDPRLKEMVGTMQKVSIDLLQKNLVGEDGKPQDPDRMDRIAAGFSALVQAPMEGWLKQTYAAGRFDSRAFVDEFDRRLAELDQRMGTKGTDWRRTIANIAKDDTPHDGRAGIIQSIARTYTEARQGEAEGR